MFKGLDHIAYVTDDAESVLSKWSKSLKFKEAGREIVNSGSTLLIHIDLGNTHLQLVQPLTEDHPLKLWLKKHGSGLHHLCFSVESVDAALNELMDAGIRSAETEPHQGMGGKQAIFLDDSTSGGIIVELTGG